MNRTQQILLHTWWVGALVVVSSILCMLEVGGCIDRTTHQPQQNKPITNWRYFLVTYETITVDGQNVAGNCLIQSEGFPSHSAIDSAFMKSEKKSRDYFGAIVVANLFEFKDSIDYKNFQQ